MKYSVSLATAALGLALASSLESAQAATLSNTLSCSVTKPTMTYTACSGSYNLASGENDVTNGGVNNVATKLLNNDDLFGAKDWTFGAKYSGTWEGANSGGMAVTGLTASTAATQGTLTFGKLDLKTTDLVISLKSATSFSLYYIKAGTIVGNSINWNTLGTSQNKSGKAQNLSHVSYYTRIGDALKTTPSNKVPEPTAMTAIAMAGVAAALRRKAMGQ